MLIPLCATCAAGLLVVGVLIDLAREITAARRGFDRPRDEPSASGVYGATSVPLWPAIGGGAVCDPLQGGPPSAVIVAEEAAQFDLRP